MSRRDTVASRIEEIRRSIPPADGRRSRLGYISKDDFADLIGAGRTRVIAWTTGQSFPEERYRVRLAELSRGRWQPADFARDQEVPADRLAALEAEVDALAEALRTARQVTEKLQKRVAKLERAAQQAPRRERQAELSTRQAPRRRGSAAQ